MPDRGALTKVMFGHHDTLARAAMVKSWPVADHHVVALPNQPVSLSLFRGLAHQHSQALIDHLTARGTQFGGLFMLGRSEIALDPGRFDRFVEVLTTMREQRSLWVADARTGVWDWIPVPRLRV